MAARIFAVLAAAFLVSSVAIAALTPLGLTLSHGLLMLSPGSLSWLRAHNADWSWDWLVWPVLQRPLWLIPVSLGLIFAGLAMTFNLGKASPSRRRRS